jgi:hypothetical protein
VAQVPKEIVHLPEIKLLSMRQIAFLLLLFWQATDVLQAQLAPSNVYVFSIRQLSDSTYSFVQPRYLTSFNARGYNNQPYFFSNTELYLSVQTPGQSQTDLYAFDLERRTKTRVTNTPEGEYSPARMPDYYSFSAVRQEVVGRDTFLRLWQFPVDRLTNGRPVFKYLNGMGYYCWLNNREVALFKVGSPNTLVLANTDTDQETLLATNAGRCLHKMPNGNLAYVQKNDFSPWTIMERNIFRRDAPAQRIVTTLPEIEDFAVLPDGTLLAGKGSKIYKFNRFKDGEWEEVADLRYYNIRNIKRLAVSNDYKIAIVTE